MDPLHRRLLLVRLGHAPHGAAEGYLLLRPPHDRLEVLVDARRRVVEHRRGVDALDEEAALPRERALKVLVEYVVGAEHRRDHALLLSDAVGALRSLLVLLRVPRAIDEKLVRGSVQGKRDAGRGDGARHPLDPLLRVLEPVLDLAALLRRDVPGDGEPPLPLRQEVDRLAVHGEHKQGLAALLVLLHDLQSGLVLRDGEHGQDPAHLLERDLLLREKPPDLLDPAGALHERVALGDGIHLDVDDDLAPEQIRQLGEHVLGAAPKRDALKPLAHARVGHAHS